MRTIFYNAHEFEKALGVVDNDPNIALTRFEKYLEKFPRDYDGRTFYISLLIKLKNLGKAEVELLKLEKEMAQDFKFQQHIEKNDKTFSSLIFCKVKLLFYQNKYQQCYDLMNSNLTSILKYNIHFEPTALLCKKRIGLLDSTSISDSDGYLYRQILDYSEERFLDHIKKHLTTNEQIEEEKPSVFKEDFPFDKVFNEIKKNTPSNLRIYNGLIEDLYIYKYDFCGTNDNKQTDYFKVIALHDTSDFITMCPSTEGKNWDCLDLNYLREEKPPEKKISQVTKFNQRYKKTLDK